MALRRGPHDTSGIGKAEAVRVSIHMTGHITGRAAFPGWKSKTGCGK
jgi:hypothetical protein